MSDRWIGITDPREGEWPEPGEWCARHGQRAESCGPCFDEARAAERADRELTDNEFLAAALVAMLDKIEGVKR